MVEKRSILVLDPNTEELYRYNFSNDSCIKESEYTEKAKRDIKSELLALYQLRGFDITGWSFRSSEANLYRSRKISESFLQTSVCQYPSFTTFRELSSAFASVTYIRLFIDISRYVGSKRQSLDSNIRSSEAKEMTPRDSFRYSKADKIIELKVSLVSTVSEVIDYMLKKILDDFNLKIVALNPKNQLTFKVRGRKEFFTGNYPMLAYKSVRSSLRGMQFLSVNLTDIPLDLDVAPSPFITDDESVKTLFHFFMYYRPSWLYEPSSYNTQSNLLKQTISKPLVHAERIESTSLILRGVNCPSFIYTGECDWPFRIKICGVENLYNLFAEAFRGNATNNGTENPAYVQLPKFKEKKQDLRKSRFSSGSSGGDRRESVPLLASKLTKIAQSSGGGIGRSAYINSGGSASISRSLADEFNLPFSPYLLRFDIKLLYGDTVLKNNCFRSSYFPFRYSSRLMEWIEFPIKISAIPKETRIGLNIYILSQIGESCLIGSTCKSLFNESGNIRSGVQSLNIWPFYKIEERLACMEEFWGNCTDYETLRQNQKDSYAKIFLEFQSFVAEDVKWSLKDYSHLKNMYGKIKDSGKNDIKMSIKKINKKIENFRVTAGYIGDDPEEENEQKYIKTRPKIEELACLEKILLKDPLEILSDAEKRLLFICRDHYKTMPLALSMFLKSIDWTKPLQVNEAYKYMKIWSCMQPEDALSLLSSEFPDQGVRFYATKKFQRLPDDDFTLYMPQLIQALTFESSHHTHLSELLIERSLKNPHQVGHTLFWALRSQLHIKAKAERFGLILEQFLMYCGVFRDDLLKQIGLVTFYSDLALKLREKDSYQDRERLLKSLIAENEDKAQTLCTLPVDSSLEISGPNGDKCKVMDSKKMPLFLTLINSESASGFIPIIFKVGDDLRQDILSLQMIRVMDTIWLENGLDLRMKPYQVIATGDQSGIIEAVVNSETTAQIHRDYGGTLGALRKNTLRDYLLEHNPSDEQLDRAMDNFIRSCAGYCVATYILGIGDRHNGNIMMTRTGHLFHIDFGHILGNFKTALGIQRERSKFVLTEEMVFVMGGKDSEGFEKFKDYCCKAYNYVRNHGKRLISLFLFMVTAGMPELNDKEEIKYLREMLSLKLTEMEADGRFIEEIITSLNNTFRRIDNLFHNFKH